VALIDHQGQNAVWNKQFRPPRESSHTVAFGKARKAFDVPVVLTTVRDKSFSREYVAQLRAYCRGRNPSKRSSMTLWDEQTNLSPAIEKSDAEDSHCRPLTETCVALPTVQALHERLTKSTSWRIAAVTLSPTRIMTTR